MNATEEAINLMRAVLENVSSSCRSAPTCAKPPSHQPEPIKNLASLIKAQQAFYAQAAEALSSVVASVEEAQVQSEADFRKSRAQ